MTSASIDPKLVSFYCDKKEISFFVLRKGVTGPWGFYVFHNYFTNSIRCVFYKLNCIEIAK